MIREYKTIREISGPLMVVDHVQGITYDELAEIVLSDGSTRRCKVLEVNGDRAVVQLFEASAGTPLARPIFSRAGMAKSSLKFPPRSAALRHCVSYWRIIASMRA